MLIYRVSCMTSYALMEAGKTFSPSLYSWNLIFHPDLFHAEKPLSIVLFFPFPFVVAAYFKDGIVRSLLTLAIFYTIFWFFSAQILRYLVPVLPLFCIAAAVSVERYLIRLSFIRRLIDKNITVVTVAILLILPGWVFAFKTVNHKGFPPINEKERESYLSQELPSYKAYSFLNSISGNRYRLYALLDENMAYFANGQFIGDWFGPGRYRKILDKLGNEDRLFNELRSLGAECFIVNICRLPKKIQSTWLSQKKWLSWKYIYPVFGGGNVILFKITGRKMCHQISPEILIDTSLEKLSLNEPTSWKKVGIPIVDRSGESSADGKAAVKCNKDNFLKQTVDVEQNILYILACKAYSERTTNKARLQINWLDKYAKQFELDIIVINASAAWMQYSNVIIAPERAEFAEICAGAHKDGAIWFDEFSFKALSYAPCQAK